MRFSRRSKFRTVSICLSVAVALVGCEIFLRLINYRPATVDPEIYVANKNDLLPYKLRPTYDNYYLGERVTVDADGYRVVPTLLGNPGSNEKTVVVLGDSLVFGYGLRNEDTLAAKLETQVVAKHLNFRVRNIGAPGYTSWNEYAAFQDYLTRFKADQVLLIYNPNDVTFDNDYFEIGKGGQAAFSHNRLHRSLQFLYSHMYTAFLASDTAKKIYSRVNGNLKKDSSSNLAEINNQPALDYSMEAISAIQKLCAERGVRFSVGIYRDTPLYNRLPEKFLAFEKLIEQNLDRRMIKWFQIKSHSEHLAPADAQVFWNDPHPSPQAVDYIVGDLMKELEVSTATR
jgi:hypothetical protein